MLANLVNTVTRIRQLMNTVRQPEFSLKNYLLGFKSAEINQFNIFFYENQTITNCHSFDLSYALMFAL